jgi:hypothetical protein
MRYTSKPMSRSDGPKPKSTVSQRGAELVGEAALITTPFDSSRFDSLLSSANAGTSVLKERDVCPFLPGGYVTAFLKSPCTESPFDAI